jgi:hypothetical protein
MKWTHKVICDICGFKYNSDEVKKRWDGMVVCKQDFEEKHPSLTYKYRHKSTEGSLPVGALIRSEPEDTFVFLCDLYTSMGVAGYGTAGCAQAGTYNLGMSPLPSLTVVPIVENRIIP